MAWYLAHVFLLAWTFAAVGGAFDEAFCKKKIKDYDNFKKGTAPPIIFKDNYHLFAEVKEGRDTQYLDVYYSEQYEKAFYDVKAIDGSNKLWLYANTDELIVESQGNVCQEEFLVNSTFISEFLEIERSSDGSVSLPIPSEIDRSLHWWFTGTKNLIDRGQATLPDRGIPARLYESCEYREEHDSTSVTQWFFSDTNNTMAIMPERPNEPVLLVAKVTVVDDEHFGPDPVEKTTRYDFTRFTTGIKETDEHFELPATNLCIDRPPADDGKHPIPNIPNDFYFKAEQITIQRDTPNAVPSLNRVAEGYYADFNMSVVAAEEITGIGNFTSRTEWLHVVDFFTGLAYSVDTTLGTCDVMPVTGDDVTAKTTVNGTVRMRSPSGFLNLESGKYEYMGVHRHLERGIDCDVWSAYIDDGEILPNALYTWYFATKDWRDKDELDDSKPLPVSLKVTSEEMVYMMDIFEFTTTNSFTAPDVSDCFNASLTKNVRFSLDAFYDQVVQGDEQSFHSALVKSILSVTGIISPLRLSELKVYPNDQGIGVEFKLLDKRPEKSAEFPVHQQSNLQAVEALHIAVKAGRFNVNVEEGFGTKSVKAVKDSFTLIDPRYTPVTTSEPNKAVNVTMPDGAKTTTSKGKSTERPDKGKSTERPDKGKSTERPDKGKSTERPDKGKSTERPNKGKSTESSDKGKSTGSPENAGNAKNHGDNDSSSEAMYTSGEMAGLAIGMIFLTSIVVFVGLYIYKRIGRKTPTEYHDMETLGSS